MSLSLHLSGWPENSESRQRMLESSSSTNFVQHFVSREVSNKERLLCLFRRLRNGLVLVLTPLFFGQMLNWEGPEWKCAYCVCIIAIYWMSEVMPLAVTAMLPVVLFPLVGVLDANTTAKEYMNDTNFLFIGGLIMAAAVEKCDLHERVALSVLRCVGSEPKWIMLGFMTVTALLSSFISNTATTAMMVPIGQSVVQQLISSFQHHPTNGERGRVGCKKMATGLVLSICFAANIGGTGTATGTPSNLVMLGQLNALFPKVDGSLNYVTWIFFAYPLMLLCLGVAWATLVWFFLRDAPEKDEAVTEMLKTRYNELPRMTYAEKSVFVCFCILLSLWIFRNPGIVPGFGVFFKKGAYTDATSAMIVAFLLFILPSEKPDLATYIKKEDLKKKGCLMDWKTMQETFPWSVVLLLGGGFALAAGVKESGLSLLIGNSLSSIGHLPLWILQLLTMFIAMIITNICSNTVTASIFVPIVATLAQKAGHHPFTLMLPTTLASSFAFIFPVGTPPNAIVFGSGMVKVSDMAFVGGIISMELLVLTILYMNSIAYLTLPLLEFPSWAVIANSTMQT
ncbi:CRE-NAC-3 protein [Caenorhabditis remanei]|uniref:CRE-NAC-3 protein n=1 Tax=Caenorhabditis remanei TaxID=31234 RepID=E3LRY0_CAERE|nr:CRE-NAC-3 protein [Caenorhabditis remanei]